MKDTFSLVGTLSIMYTDNGPQYSAPLFAKFATEWEFYEINILFHKFYRYIYLTNINSKVFYIIYVISHNVLVWILRLSLRARQ